MKLTAQLAYSQIKRNRVRTRWTLMGIIISTALLTAICSFVASALDLDIVVAGQNLAADGINQMVGFIWPIAVVLGLLVIMMSVIVIANIFWVSAAARTGQFGILKSVGATKQQITATVMYEGIFIAARGIPVGIAVGLGLAYAGIVLANIFLGEINGLTQLMIREFSIEIHFTVTWPALVAAAAISFMTVLFSAWRPARKAARIAAIDSIRSVGEVKITYRQKPVNPLILKMFGCEGLLAAQNIRRSGRNFRAGVISMTLSIILFVNIAALSRQADQAMNWLSNPELGNPLVVDYTSDMTGVDDPSAGDREIRTINVPINNQTADTVTSRLLEYGDTAVFGVGYDMETYEAVIPAEMVMTQMAEIWDNEAEVNDKETDKKETNDKETNDKETNNNETNDKETNNNETNNIGSSEKITDRNYRLSAEIIIIDPDNYAKLCELAGVPFGANILLNHYRHNDNGQLSTVAPFLYRGQQEETVSLIKFGDNKEEIAIHGVLAAADVPAELIGLNNNVVRVIVPQAECRGYMWYVDAADRSGFMTYAEAVIQELFPDSSKASYMEQGFNVRVYEMSDYMKVMNIPIIMAEVFIYCFVILLLVIGLTNVISTMSANIRARSREFAVLQSIGMTHDGLNRMLKMESIMSSAKMLLFGLPIATILTYVINRPIRKLFPIPWQWPWPEALGCAVFIILLSWLTIRHSAALLRNKNIVAAIRADGIVNN